MARPSETDKPTPAPVAAGSTAWLSRVPGIRLQGAVLGAVLGLTLGVAVGLAAIGQLLITMHPPNLAGRGLAQGFATSGLGGGAEAAAAAFEAWRTFDALRFSTDLLSAFTVARLWLVVDFVFVILYTVSVLALARVGGALSGGETANTLAATRLLVLALAVTDVLENSIALYATSIESTSEVLLSALFYVRSFKLFVLVLPLVALLLLLVLRKVRALLTVPRVRQGLVAARAQILVVLLIAVVLWYQPTSDVLLDTGTSQNLSILVFGGLLCAGLGMAARVLIDRDRVELAPGPMNRLIANSESKYGRKIVGSSVALVLAASLVVLALVTGWRGLWGAALIVVSVLGASWVLQDSEDPSPVEISGRSTASLPAILGLAPLGLLGVALIHWTLWADIVLTKAPLKSLAGLGVLAAAGALITPISRMVGAAQIGADDGDATRLPVRLVTALARCNGTYGFVTWMVIFTVLALPVVLLLYGTRFVDERYLGPTALMFGAAAMLNAVTTGLIIGADWWRDEFGLPSVFKALRMRRIPVFLLLVLWVVINAFVLADPSYHDVATSGTNQRVALRDAYEDWKQVNITGDAEVVPLVVVAAEGGGLRAAYWTERVLTEVFADSDVDPFVLSGTSGGSVGIATYMAKHEPLGDAFESEGVGLADVPDPDFLSAVFQRWFTFDLAHSLLRQPKTVGNRAGALADALAAEIPALRAPYDYAPPEGEFQPVTIFNTADLQDGCLAPISTLSDLAGPAVTQDDLGCLDPDRPVLDALGAARFPGAADIAFNCPGRGMTFVTAAVASARAPYITPAGRLENCGGGVFYLADGGYVDNSGAVAAAVILERLEAQVAEDNAAGDVCIVPILLQIDNGAESLIPGGQATGNPSQFTVVVTGALASSSSRHDIAKVAAAALVRQPLVDADGREIAVTYMVDPAVGRAPVDRYYRIFPLAQAGRDATVGWLLSQPSKDTLDTQVEVAITDAKLILSPAADLSCG